MDLLYLIIFIVITMINDIETVLLKKTDLKSFSTKKILFVSEESSILQCAKRCKFRDKNAIVEYKDTTCKCISNEDDDENKDLQTLSGIFLNEEIVRMELINIAFNKTANQSSTYRHIHIPGGDELSANNAIDGELSTESATKQEFNQWWILDLNGTFHITYMLFKSHPGTKILNRKLNVESRQKQDDPWVKCKDLGSVVTSSLNFTCVEKTFARYVRISSTEKCHIQIYEFEVYDYVVV